MNKHLSPLWTHLTSEGRLTGTWRSALPNYQNQPSPCLNACPVNGRIAEWIKQVKDGDIHGAWLTLVDNNPFPAIAGRICHHPCESACNRVELDETVGICSLERFVGDTALEEGWQFVPADAQGTMTVAIVGGGPAGLSAAYQLRRRGIQVSLFEAKHELGGLMRYGIPSYRLSREVLNAEIDRITAMGMDLHLGAEVLDIDALTDLQDKFDAVFMATGASLPKNLPGLDYSQPWVIDSADFLAAPTAQQSDRIGRRVVVIGGGSAAMDVARSARRLGSEVTVLSLEPDGKLPAQKIEIDEAFEEGVRFVSGAMMQSVKRAKNQSVTLHCVEVDFQPGPPPGTFSALPKPDSNFELGADTIIPAIGQDADTARWEGILKAQGPVIGVGPNWQTGNPRIYAGGDLASTDRFVTAAIGSGKEAAQGICAALETVGTQPPELPPEQVGYGRINTAYQVQYGRKPQQSTDVTTRLRGFAEVQQPLTQVDAASEASRCFSCGTCIYCDNCYFYCPDMAISKTADGYVVDPDYCKGCGLCVAECPTGSIHMQEDTTS